MTTLGLNHYNLRAHPELLEQLRTFYCEVVGLSVGFRPAFNSGGYWLYAGERAVLHLSTVLPDEPLPVAAVTTFNHVAFSCTDSAAFEHRLRQNGVSYKMTHVPQTQQLQIFFKDPASNGIELNFENEVT